MAEDASTVRVCLTRCPLPPTEERVHSLPCRIHFDGPAPVKTLFRPQRGDCLEVEGVKKEKKSDGEAMQAEFRGIQLQGQKLELQAMGYTGLVLEDSGLRHTDDEGRIWEVEDHFKELTWWDVTNHTTSETQQLPLMLQQWSDVSSAAALLQLQPLTSKPCKCPQLYNPCFRFCGAIGYRHRNKRQSMFVTLALSRIEFIPLQPSPASVAMASRSPHSRTLVTRNKALQIMRAQLKDAVAKLVLLPVVGVSLCGAVTLLLGLQWVEALQRRRQALQWRTRLWATLLTLLLTLLPSKRLEAAVTPAEKGPSRLKKEVQLYSGDKRDAHDGDAVGGDDESYTSRPAKRQRSEPNEGERVENVGQDDRQDEEKQTGDETTSTKVVKPGSSVTPRIRRRVFIWDLDETLVLFASLYSGTFAQTHGKEVAPGVALGEQMMTFLLAMLERHFFFSDLHDADVDHIAHVVETENATDQQQKPTVQERYERIREIYERRGHVDFLHDTNSEWFAIRGALIAAIDNFSTGWLHEARQVLELIAESAKSRVEPTQPEAHPETESIDASKDEEEVENVNVMVTNTQLVPALCKCLIYQLDAFFPIDRVYSSAKVHKYRCFQTIMEKYEAPDVEFVAIGDGLEEEQVSLALGLEFHKIRSLVDLKRLRYDLQLVQANSNSSTPASAVVDSPVVAAAQMSVASSPVGQTAVV